MVAPELAAPTDPTDPVPTVVLSPGLAGRLRAARARPCLITAIAPETDVFPPHGPTNGSLGNVWALTAFCPVSVLLLRHGFLSRHGRTQAYRSTPPLDTDRAKPNP
ncbi:unnamed protein product [Rangifer tarandus platyrhynchus]|uniref:Uncharacterized protein n=1 Tax=Rangifer tarandus platyrhynchus TaxID=3082113 RepID=A0ABN8ZWU7_RANTA|nr:unnamed protein product [Rangifer tarandus platyrhynchus]